jgi:LCP family protein required for cell wall assembly
MRTTLKRGMGRAAALNGNGRAVLPPPVLEPMRRYRQPPPPTRSTARLIGKVFGWIMLALLVVASGLAGGLYLYGHESLNALAPHTEQVKIAIKNLTEVPPPTEPATALVVGYDQRAGKEAFGAKDSRSDTIMLLRADPQLDTLSILSFPRDLDVPIYCKDPNVAVTTDRINSAWSTCGVEGTLNTVQKLTGVPVNYLITVNFHGFKLLVNKLGGVYMTVDHRYINTRSGPYGYATINLHPGYQKLDGQEALDFVRFRHTDSDVYRLARQQLFLEALKDRVASGLSLTDIPKLIGALKNNLEIGRGGSNGAPTMSEVQSYVGLGYHLQPGHLFRLNIDNLQDCGYLNAQVCAQPSDIQAAVETFLHPDVTLPDRANRAALGRKPQAPKAPDLKPAQVSTLVLNGTTIAGLARDTSYKLAVAGFHTVQLPASILGGANAPTASYYSNYVYFDTVQPNAKQAAEQLKFAMGSNTKLAPLPPEIAPYAQESGNPLTVVVVGTAFGGELVNPQAHVVEPPTHEPPAVRSDGGVTLGLLRDVPARVPFPVMAPSVVHSASRLTQYEPLRVFKPYAHKKEVVLTYVTGAGNIYWQIIETNWTSAPILRKPTGKVTLKGRKFLLFTNGGHIHMVVLRRGDASYWVVNTLRDELSNETMLAIAKGLRPTGK